MATFPSFAKFSKFELLASSSVFGVSSLGMESISAQELANEFERLLGTMHQYVTNDSKVLEIANHLVLHVYYELYKDGETLAREFMKKQILSMKNQLRLDNDSRWLLLQTLLDKQLSKIELQQICQPSDPVPIYICKKQEQQLFYAFERAQSLQLARKVFQLVRHQPEQHIKQQPEPQERKLLCGVNDSDKCSYEALAELYSIVNSYNDSGLQLPQLQSASVHHCTAQMTFCAFSRAHQLAVGFDDCSVSVLDEDKCMCNFYGHIDNPHSAAFTYDSQFLVTTGGDSNVFLWCVKSDDNTKATIPLQSYTGHQTAVWCSDTHPYSASLFATGGRDRTVQLQCSDRQLPLRTFVGHLSDIDNVCFHPNGSILISAGLDGCVRLWDLASARCLRTICIRTRGFLSGISISPNGKMLAIASDDRHIRVYDLASCNSPLWDCKGHTDTPTCLTWSSCNGAVASADFSNRVLFWEGSTGALIDSSDIHNIQAPLCVTWPSKSKFVAAGLAV